MPIDHNLLIGRQKQYWSVIAKRYKKKTTHVYKTVDNNDNNKDGSDDDHHDDDDDNKITTAAAALTTTLVIVWYVNVFLFSIKIPSLCFNLTVLISFLYHSYSYVLFPFFFVNDVVNEISCVKKIRYTTLKLFAISHTHSEVGKVFIISIVFSLVLMLSFVLILRI